MCLNFINFLAVKPWSSTHLDDLPTRASFYALSPFGNYALHKFYDLKIPLSKPMYASIGKTLDINDDDDTDLAYSELYENPTYSIDFLEYLIRNVFCFGCLFDHSLITLNSYSADIDTNASSESWNKVCLEIHKRLFFGLTLFLISASETRRDDPWAWPENWTFCFFF